jgi:hypothetical protein
MLPHIAHNILTYFDSLFWKMGFVTFQRDGYIRTDQYFLSNLRDQEIISHYKNHGLFQNFHSRKLIIE